MYKKEVAERVSFAASWWLQKLLSVHIRYH